MEEPVLMIWACRDLALGMFFWLVNFRSWVTNDLT